MVARLGKALLVAVLILAAGLVAVFFADGAGKWVGPLVIAAIVALIYFGLRYVLVRGKG